MCVALDFATQHAEQVKRLLLVEILDDLLKLIEEHHRWPPVTRSFDGIQRANHSGSL